MRQIKFSSDYHKMPENANGKIAHLRYVQVIELEKQTTFFLNYDTTIRNGLAGHSVYELPEKGKYLLLLFDCEGTMFTTLRRWTIEKALYYQRQVNEQFEIKIGD